MGRVGSRRIESGQEVLKSHGSGQVKSRGDINLTGRVLGHNLPETDHSRVGPPRPASFLLLTPGLNPRIRAADPTLEKTSCCLPSGISRTNTPKVFFLISYYI